MAICFTASVASLLISEPYKAAIPAGLDRGLSAQRIYQDLVVEQQSGGSYDSVKRAAPQATPKPAPSNPSSCEAGTSA